MARLQLSPHRNNTVIEETAALHRRDDTVTEKTRMLYVPCLPHTAARIAFHHIPVHAMANKTTNNEPQTDCQVKCMHETDGADPQCVHPSSLPAGINTASHQVTKQGMC